MKKKIFLSVSTLLVCVMLIIGVTYAVLFDNDDVYTGDLVVGEVSVGANLEVKNDDGTFETTNNLDIKYMETGSTYTYKVTVTNTGNYDVRFRNVLSAYNDTKLLDVVTVSIYELDDSSKKYDEETMIFKADRSVSEWTTGFETKDKTVYFIDITLEQSISDNYKQSSMNLELKIEAIEDRFIEVNSTEDVAKLVDGEYAILSNDFSGDLELTKGIYLDLNGKTIKNLTVNTEKECTFEFLNGTISNVNITADKSIFYCYAQVSQGTISSAQHSFYYLSNSNAESTLTLVGGSLVLDTASNVSVTINQETETNDIKVVVSSTTTVSNIVVTNANNTVNIENNGIINNMDLSDNDNVLVEGNEVKLDTSAETAYVTSEDSVYYVVEEGTTKFAAIVDSLQTALDNNFKTIYLVGSVHNVTSLSSDVKIIGVGSTEITSSIQLNGLTVTFESITFTDAIVDSIGSTVTFNNCIFANTTSLEYAINAESSSTINLINCSFDEFTYPIKVNELNSDSSSVYVDSLTTFNDNEYSVVYFSDTKTVLSNDEYLIIDEITEGLTKTVAYKTTYNQFSQLLDVTGEVHVSNGTYAITNTTLVKDVTFIGYKVVTFKTEEATLFEISSKVKFENIKFVGVNSDIALKLLDGANVETQSCTFEGFNNNVVIYGTEDKATYVGDETVKYIYLNYNVVSSSIGDLVVLNNTTTLVAKYDSVATAIDEVDADETIYINGSMNITDTLSVNKNLKFIGLNNAKLSTQTILFDIQDSSVDFTDISLATSSTFIFNVSATDEDTITLNNASVTGVIYVNADRESLPILPNAELIYYTSKHAVVGAENSYFVQKDEGITYHYLQTYSSLYEALKDFKEIIYVCAGEYEFNNAITFTDNVEIIGSSVKDVKFKSLMNSTFINIEDCSVKISNINFVDNSTLKTGTCIKTSSESEVESYLSIDTCEFTGFTSKMFVLTGSTNAVIKNSTLNGASDSEDTAIVIKHSVDVELTSNTFVNFNVAIRIYYYEDATYTNDSNTFTNVVYYVNEMKNELSVVSTEKAYDVIDEKTLVSNLIEYKTIEAAILAGETNITIYGSITLSEIININSDVTFTGVNCTLLGSLETLFVINNCTVVFKNIKIDNSQESNITYFKVTDSTLTLTNCNLTGNKTQTAVYAENSTVNLTGNEIKNFLYAIYMDNNEEELLNSDDLGFDGNTYRYVYYLESQAVVSTNNSDSLFEQINNSNDAYHFSVKYNTLESALADEGAKIYILPGTYIISKSIIITYDVEIIGIGNVILQRCETGFNTTLLSVRGCDAKISGVTFQERENAPVNSFAIQTETDENSLTLDYCIFNGFTLYTVLLSGTSAKVTNCTFNVTSGIAVHTWNGCVTTISDCVFKAAENSESKAVGLNSGAKVTLSNSTIDSTVKYGVSINNRNDNADVKTIYTEGLKLINNATNPITYNLNDKVVVSLSGAQYVDIDGDTTFVYYTTHTNLKEAIEYAMTNDIEDVYVLDGTYDLDSNLTLNNVNINGENGVKINLNNNTITTTDDVSISKVEISSTTTAINATSGTLKVYNCVIAASNIGIKIESNVSSYDIVKNTITANKTIEVNSDTTTAMTSCYITSNKLNGALVLNGVNKVDGVVYMPSITNNDIYSSNMEVLSTNHDIFILFISFSNDDVFTSNVVTSIKENNNFYIEDETVNVSYETVNDSSTTFYGYYK